MKRSQQSLPHSTVQSYTRRPRSLPESQQQISPRRRAWAQPLFPESQNDRARVNNKSPQSRQRRRAGALGRSRFHARESTKNLGTPERMGAADSREPGEFRSTSRFGDRVAQPSAWAQLPSADEASIKIGRVASLRGTDGVELAAMRAGENLKPGQTNYPHSPLAAVCCGASLPSVSVGPSRRPITSSILLAAPLGTFPRLRSAAAAQVLRVASCHARTSFAGRPCPAFSTQISREIFDRRASADNSMSSPELFSMSAGTQFPARFVHAPGKPRQRSGVVPE